MVKGALTRREFLASLAGLATTTALAADEPEERIAAAANRGLAYLARRQGTVAQAGSWGERGHVGITSLAALAFASAGRFPARGAGGETLDLAIEYVLGQAQPHGLIGPSGAAGRDVAYGHGLAALLLAEVSGMARDADQERRIKGVLARAVRLLVGAQGRQGGWRYELQPSSDADASVTATQLMALRSAADAGVEVPDQVFERGKDYLRSCQVLPDGGFRYQPAIGPMGFPLTAAGLVGYHCCGLVHGEEVDAARRYLEPYQADKPSRPPVNPDYFLYGHHHAALAQRVAGGMAASKWQQAIANLLMGQQRTDGSWSDAKFGDHYATAMACLILLTPRSCLPLLRI